MKFKVLLKFIMIVSSIVLICSCGRSIDDSGYEQVDVMISGDVEVLKKKGYYDVLSISSKGGDFTIEGYGTYVADSYLGEIIQDGKYIRYC